MYRRVSELHIGTGKGVVSILYGLQLIEDKNCGVMVIKQFRFPRSKKRRIRNKWAKQPKNFKAWLEPRAYQIGNKIIAHPALIAQIRKLSAGA